MAETFSTKGTGISNVTHILNKDYGYPKAASNPADAQNFPNPVDTSVDPGTTVTTDPIVTIPGGYVGYDVPTVTGNDYTIDPNAGSGTGTVITENPIIGDSTTHTAVVSVTTVGTGGEFQVNIDIAVALPNNPQTDLYFPDSLYFKNIPNPPYTSGDPIDQTADGHVFIQGDLWERPHIIQVSIPADSGGITIERIGYTCVERPGLWRYISGFTIENTSYPAAGVESTEMRMYDYTVLDENDIVVGPAGDPDDAIETIIIEFHF